MVWWSRGCWQAVTHRDLVASNRKAVATRPSTVALRRRYLSVQPAALDAVEQINHQADAHPAEEADPSDARQLEHEVAAGGNTADGNQGYPGRAEGPGPVGVGIAQDQNPGR